MYLWIVLYKTNKTALIPQLSQIAAKYGHLIIFGPPHSPQYQPAELLNAHVKFNVKKTAYKHRTISELKNNIRDGFYGGKTLCGREHKPIDTNIIKGWIKTCHSVMTQDIKKYLEIDKIPIENLWNNESKHKVTDMFIRFPRSAKMIQDMANKFVIVYDDIDQDFVNYCL